MLKLALLCTLFIVCMQDEPKGKMIETNDHEAF